MHLSQIRFPAARAPLRDQRMVLGTRASRFTSDRTNRGGLYSNSCEPQQKATFCHPSGQSRFPVTSSPWLCIPIRIPQVVAALALPVILGQLGRSSIPFTTILSWRRIITTVNWCSILLTSKTKRALSLPRNWTTLPKHTLVTNAKDTFGLGQQRSLCSVFYPC